MSARKRELPCDCCGKHDEAYMDLPVTYSKGAVNGEVTLKICGKCLVIVGRRNAAADNLIQTALMRKTR